MKMPVLILFFLVALGFGQSVVYGFDLLKGVMPGEVSSLHEKVEGKCLDCHTIGQKTFFSKCISCHKESGKDVDQKKGFHGKIDSTRCETCHSEHKGRGNPLIEFDPLTFDHKKTEFELTGKHQKTKCAECHTKHKFRETPHPCLSCHQKDDKHKGGLGKECARCHNTASWKEIKFDHSKTKFSLEGKHAPVKCEKCHTQNNFTMTPTACISCHLKEDKHKGEFGKECHRCHTAQDWKKIKFDHDRTKFKLTGKHDQTPCAKCHLNKLFDQTPKTCVGCHLKQDKHKGVLGKQCESCHTTETWKEPVFDHNKFDFRLIGFHQKTDCLKCHKDTRLKETPKLCFDCHKKEDKHKGSLGQSCDRCHLIVEKWKEIRFDHSTTKYPLAGKHIPVACAKCHAEERYKISGECSTCHQKDDKHKGKLGETCQRCHTEKSWKEIDQFDHQKTSFPLTGKHEPVKCSLCHKTPLFKDTSSVCNDCHIKDDYHKGKFGKKCESCHGTNTWKRKDFDHFKETGYRLIEKHSPVKCVECHTRTLFVRKTSRMCVTCHKKDDIHDDELGPRCEICHSEIGFKIIKRDGATFP